MVIQKTSKFGQCPKIIRFLDIVQIFLKEDEKHPGNYS